MDIEAVYIRICIPYKDSPRMVQTGQCLTSSPRCHLNPTFCIDKICAGFEVAKQRARES
jgi:hypothetical protein